MDCPVCLCIFLSVSLSNLIGTFKLKYSDGDKSNQTLTVSLSNGYSHFTDQTS